MYQNIRARKTTRELYAESLAAAGLVDAAGAQALVDGYRGKLDRKEVTTEVAAEQADPYAVDWKPWLKGKLADVVKTGLPRFSLDSLAKKINTIAGDVVLHPRVAKI
jgi:2-oxoglutarate dehydrogenase E1 component